MPSIYHTSTPLAASAETTFDFHSDPHNQWGQSWWGRLVSEAGVRLYLTLLFKYRHYRTRQWANLKAGTELS
jgi:hypothetical protein